jgi:hypothetical protein
MVIPGFGFGAEVGPSQVDGCGVLYLATSAFASATFAPPEASLDPLLDEDVVLLLLELPHAASKTIDAIALPAPSRRLPVVMVFTADPLTSPL